MRKFIKDYLAKEYDNYVKDLEALTNIDSGNGDLEGTEAANKFVAAKMQALGAETEFRYNDRGCHLISRLKGKGTQTVLLVAHVDTVFKRGEAAKRPFRVDENGFAWGPGVGDDKATVMEVIYGLAAFKESGFDDYKKLFTTPTPKKKAAARLPKVLWQSFRSRQILPLLWTLRVRTGAL